jgi:hypothetical protein
MIKGRIRPAVIGIVLFLISGAFGVKGRPRRR